MKLSSNTLNLLNNFSTINSGITVKTGNEISTVSAMKNIFAKAIVDETFEQEHSIYDLSEYLGAVSLFDTPDFVFNGESVDVSEGDNSVRYYYADPQMVISPQKDITMPEPEITFDLDGTAGEVIMKPAVDSDDLVISQYDGTEVIRIEDNASLGLVGNKLSIANSSSDVVIKPLTDAKDIIFQQYDGTEVARVEDNATFNIGTSKLAINGTAVTATAAELNLLDGGTSVGGSITLADSDGVVVNDGGTMKTIPASDVKTYASGSGTSAGQALAYSLIFGMQ